MSDPLHDADRADEATRAEMRRLLPHLERTGLEEGERSRIMRAVAEHPRLAARLAEALARLAETTERLQRIERDHRTSAARQDGLRFEISALREDSAVLEAERDRLCGEAETTRHELNAALLRIAELETEAVAAARAAARLDDRLKTAERELHRLRGENEGLRLDAMTSERRAEALQLENETLSRQRTGSVVRLGELERDLDRLTTAHAALQAEAEAAGSRAERLARVLDEETARRTERLKQAEESARRAEAALEEARAQADLARGKRSELETELADRRAALARLHHENAALSVMVGHGREAESRLAEAERTLRMQASRREEEDRTSVERIDALRAEIATLSERLALRDREIERLRRQAEETWSGGDHAFDPDRPKARDSVVLRLRQTPASRIIPRPPRKALVPRPVLPFEPVLFERDPTGPDKPL